MLLAKPVVRHETVNDVDGDLMLFWKVLRDRPRDLARACALTPHSRAELDLAHERGPELDELERSRRIWVTLAQGRSGTLRRTGWRHDTDPHAGSAFSSRLDAYVARMEDVAGRLRSVSLECRDGVEVVESYGRHRETLLYVDPPYLAGTRASNYRREMSGTAAHKRLADALLRSAATVVLSGYASPLYEDLYDGWHRHEIPTHTTQGTGDRARVEVLWSNRPFRNTAPFDAAKCYEMCAAPDCRRVLRQPGRGRRRKYCCDACKVRAYRTRLTV